MFCNLSVRHVEKSQASDWPSHTGNHPDAWVASRMRRNHIGTRCAISITHTEDVWMRNSRLSKTKMRLKGVEYEMSFHIEALKAESWVSKPTFSMLIQWLRLDFLSKNLDWWFAWHIEWRSQVSGSYVMTHISYCVCLIKRRSYAEWQLTSLSLVTVWPCGRKPFWLKAMIRSQNLM